MSYYAVSSACPAAKIYLLSLSRLALLVFGFLLSIIGMANPLERLDERWTAARYEVCNTAAGAKYLTPDEREVIWILNLMRTDPQLFNETVVSAYAAEHAGRNLTSSSYYKSLQRQLATQAPLPLLQPDETLHAGAVCLAEEQRSGAMGHQRSAACKAKRKAQGECCTYGSMTPLEIVMDLLIDEGIEDLGHRKLLLMPFSGISLAMRPHKTYRLSCVIELGI